jgi:hypothetical protein
MALSPDSWVGIASAVASVVGAWVSIAQAGRAKRHSDVLVSGRRGRIATTALALGHKARNQCKKLLPAPELVGSRGLNKRGILASITKFVEYLRDNAVVLDNDVVSHSIDRMLVSLRGYPNAQNQLHISQQLYDDIGRLITQLTSVVHDSELFVGQRLD